MLTVAYTGRPELGCFRLLADHWVVPVPVMVPVDLGISAAGTHIFAAEEIRRARCGIVNLHLAPLPEYRGRYSATHAILNGAREYGVTLHYVDEGIDTGPVVAEHRFPVRPGDTAGDLRRRAVVAGRAMLEWVVPRLLACAAEGDRLPARAQDDGRACYYDRHSLPESDGSPLMTRALTC